MAQLLQLLEQQLAHLVERLALLGRAEHEEGGVVALRLSTSTGTQHLHLLVDVEVDESGRAVVEDVLDDAERVGLQGVATVEAPPQPERFSFQAVDGGVAGRGDGCQGRELGLADILARLPLAEIFFKDGDGLLGIQVASHADGHIVGPVPVVEVGLDIGDAGVLQVLLRANGGLRAVGVGGEEHAAHGLPQLAVVLGNADVVLLIDGLQLGVEPSDDHVLEAVGLNLSPVFHLV